MSSPAAQCLTSLQPVREAVVNSNHAEKRGHFGMSASASPDVFAFIGSISDPHMFCQQLHQHSSQKVLRYKHFQSGIMGRLEGRPLTAASPLLGILRIQIQTKQLDAA